jgi:hypothetical protein
MYMGDFKIVAFNEGWVGADLKLATRTERMKNETFPL